jgi:hypothetical protein
MIDILPWHAVKDLIGWSGYRIIDRRRLRRQVLQSARRLRFFGNWPSQAEFDVSVKARHAIFIFSLRMMSCGAPVFRAGAPASWSHAPGRSRSIRSPLAGRPVLFIHFFEKRDST